MSSESAWIVRRCADAEEDYGDFAVYTLGLAVVAAGDDDLEGDGGIGLMLQASEPLDEDGVSVTIEPSQATAYTAVVGAVLDDGSLVLVLTDEAAELLGLEPALALAVDVPEGELDVLRGGLGRLGLLD